ncbi:MAG: ABC transporter substrate-binding protein [Chloroflexota bacterium]
MALLGAGVTASLLGACQQPTFPSRSTDTRPPELRTAEPKLTPTVAPAKPTAEPKPGADSASVGQLAPAGPPRPGGSVVWLTDADPVTLDPYAGAGAASARAWADLTYQSLVMFDENLKLVPCLALTWLNTSPTTWTFKLRPGVRFHDGSEFEAEDVTAWFERLTAAPGGPGGASPDRVWFGAVEKVQARGKYEVAFTLKAPHAPFLSSFAALRGSAIVPRHWLQSAGTALKQTAVGSGPFKIAEYVPNSHVRYVKYAEYWETRLPYLDEVVLKIAPDEETRAAALRSGQASYARLGPETAQRLKNERTLTVLSSPGASQRVVVFNTKRKPFDDARVRKAISLAVDRQAAIATISRGEGRVSGPIPPGLGDWALAPEWLGYGRDLAKAKQLLADAGLANGFDARVRTGPDSTSAISLATVLAEQLRPLGITLTVERLDRDAFGRALAAREFDAVATSVGPLPDPDAYLTPGYQIQGPLELSGWSHPKYDELVNAARTILDPNQRRALYDEASGILLDESPAIWWYAENSLEAVQASVKGYSPSFTGRWLGLKRSWLAG